MMTFSFPDVHKIISNKRGMRICLKKMEFMFSKQDLVIRITSWDLTRSFVLSQFGQLITAYTSVEMVKGELRKRSKILQIAPEEIWIQQKRNKDLQPEFQGTKMSEQNNSQEETIESLKADISNTSLIFWKFILEFCNQPGTTTWM